MIENLIKKHALTSRTPVSDESNALVEDIAKILDANIIKSNALSECLTWIIPKYWHVRSGYLKSKSGEVIADFHINPLYLWTHSISFSGTLSKKELESHVLYDMSRPNSIPYHYRNGFKYKSLEWGFCLPYNVWSNMNDDEYIVHIDADLNDKGFMLTGDCFIQGENKDTYLFSAHSCHPAQCIDGLTNLYVITKVFIELKKRKTKNSYRFVFGPEYYAAAAFLANTDDDEIKNIKGAIYADLFGAGKTLAFSTSFQGDTFIDKVVENVYKYSGQPYNKFGYRQLIGNDEMFYNGPYYNIPTVTLAENFPDNYHSDKDNYDSIDFDRLKEEESLILKIIEILETDYIPVLTYKGPLYQYRYDIYIDYGSNPQGYIYYETMQILADGKNSCFDIACKIDIDFFFVKQFFDTLIDYNLVVKL